MFWCSIISYLISSEFAILTREWNEMDRELEKWLPWRLLAKYFIFQVNHV